MAFGAQLAFVSRLRVQPRDFSPMPGGSALSGVLTGVASIADPFRSFGDISLIGWPTAGFARDWSAISHDFWKALGDYTLDVEKSHGGKALVRDLDAVVR